MFPGLSFCTPALGDGSTTKPGDGSTTRPGDGFTTRPDNGCGAPWLCPGSASKEWISVWIPISVGTSVVKTIAGGALCGGVFCAGVFCACVFCGGISCDGIFCDGVLCGDSFVTSHPDAVLCMNGFGYLTDSTSHPDAVLSMYGLDCLTGWSIGVGVCIGISKPFSVDSIWMTSGFLVLPT
jgi:hypothetical protein